MAAAAHLVQPIPLQVTIKNDQQQEKVVDFTQVCALLREKQTALSGKCALLNFGKTIANLGIAYGALKVAAFVASPLLAVGVVVGMFLLGLLVTSLIAHKVEGLIIDIGPAPNSPNWTSPSLGLRWNYHYYLPEIAAQTFEKPRRVAEFAVFAEGQNIDWDNADSILSHYKQFDPAPIPGSQPAPAQA